ncbi:MAG TPA: tautomerase family protein [Herpetosiphonaceae bacterium]|nr:tautomerase family protein [Herpetosiphonaceae bacterium]
MAQIKIYGVAEYLRPIQTRLSDVIHACVVEALDYPPGKRFHRFLPLQPEDFVFPSDRSAQYTIIEISMFEGRSAAARKRLITLLFAKIASEIGIDPQDIEITITETPRTNWGIRGRPGDELGLEYRVEV